jgi:hypothetical protein
MKETEPKRFAAGVPPWLLIALVLLLYRLPYNYELLRAEIEDFQAMEEPLRVDLALAKIEDGTSLFPLNMPGTQLKDQIDVWLKREEERRLLIQDWLMDGACARFRSAAARAHAAIEQARFMDEHRKELYEKLIGHKMEMMALNLELLDDAKLMDLARQDSRREPPAGRRTEIIAYLLDVDEKQRERLCANWKELSPDLLQDLPARVETEVPGGAGVDVWRSRVELALTKPAFLIDLGILLIPIAGLLTVFLPHWRGWKVEKRFGLEENSGELPEINEIKTFVTNRAPRVKLRVNLLRSGFAFVYPRGYRHPRLAVLGGMYALWRSDRETARGILLHEIEHVRQGDHLLVGYGSFFTMYLKYLLVSFAVLIAMHLIVSTSFSVGSVGLNPAHQGTLLMTQAVMALSSMASVLFAMMSKIVVPLLGIWALELNADYAVSREQALRLSRTETGARRPGVIRRSLGSLTHPPLWLRKWLAIREDWARGLLRHMVFPASYPVAISMFFLMGLFAKFQTDSSGLGSVAWLLGLCRESFARMYWLFGGMAAIVLLWPYLSGYWEQCFVGQRRQYRKWDVGRCIAAVLLGTLAALAWWLNSPA